MVKKITAILAMILVLGAITAFAGEKMTVEGVIQDSDNGLVLAASEETYGILSGADSDMVGKTVVVIGEVSENESGAPVIAIEEVQVKE